MSRGGRHKDRSNGPERKCVATGVVRPKVELIRFVADPDGRVVPDLSARLPGRGIWLAPEHTALEKAMKRNLFARSAKAPLIVPEALPIWVEQGLAARVTQGIGLARKAGEAVCGFEKVKSHLATSRTGALIQARDGSERGKTKLWTPEGARFIGWLDAHEIGLAFGRDSVIHAALSTGKLARQVISDAVKLKGFRNTPLSTAKNDVNKRDNAAS